MSDESYSELISESWRLHQLSYAGQTVDILGVRKRRSIGKDSVLVLI